MLQDQRGERSQDPNSTPTKLQDDLDAPSAIKAMQEELAGCGAASQLDVTVTRKTIKDALASLDQVLYTTFVLKSPFFMASHE